jgi:glycosyltransferase involved in cell wall biosynthesis
MKNRPLTSIIINNYNYAAFLPKAIESALGQSYDNTEIIVVDDGSTDGSKQIISRYADKIIPVFKTNGGQASAINAGFAQSKGSLICFLDSDDWFEERKIEYIVQQFLSHPEIEWLYHPMTVIDENKGTQEQQLPPYPEGVYDRRSCFRKGRFNFWAPATSALCFSRNVLKKILPMPVAEGILMSDKYIKELAVGLGKGFLSHAFLGYQRVHQDNLYTNKAHLKTAIKISINFAFWVRENFPKFFERANREYAYSKFLNHTLPAKERVINEYSQQFWHSSGFFTQIRILLFSLFYRLRDKLKNPQLLVSQKQTQPK